MDSNIHHIEIPENARSIYEALKTAKEEAMKICIKQSELLLRESSSFRSEKERADELERMDRAYDKTRRLVRYLKEKYEDVRLEIFHSRQLTTNAFKTQAPALRINAPKVSAHGITKARRCPRPNGMKKAPILAEIAAAPKLKGRMKSLNKIDLETLRRSMQKVDFLEDPRLKKYRL